MRVKGYGTIHRVSEYYLNCAGSECYKDSIFHGWKLASAEKCFRKEGWSKRIDGKWYCPYCKKLPITE